MPREPSPLKRTDWAERHVEDFLSLPLVREFVFRSPQTLDKNIQKEVVDFFIAHGDTGILVSQKCQDNPSARTGAKVSSWARKAARVAASQLCGALRMAKKRPVWCDHSRRGRVQFPQGLPKIDHAIVTVEVFEQADLEIDAANLPLDFQGTPISYLSLNDFLNLVIALRTTVELLEYLDARRLLSLSDLRVIGDEKSLFECYLVGELVPSAVRSRADAAIVAASQRYRLSSVLKAKSESDHYGTLLEQVADELATRHPDYADDLPEPLLTHFDPPDARENYLKMQNVLAGLRLRERAELGRAFHDTIKNLGRETEGFTYKSVCLDSKPKWVFVFASSKNIARAEVLIRLKKLISGATAFYRRNCFAVVERDSVSYEVGMCYRNAPSTEAEQKTGQELFGRLRTTSKVLQPYP